MFCPNCQNPLSQRKLSTITAEHCVFCGGTFFNINGINRILLSEAQELANEKTTDSIAGGEKLCPKDRAVMAPILSESIPQHVTLLKCGICAGIFVYPDDLVAFKQAQSAKLNYYMSWKKPMPSVANIVVLGFAVVASAVVFYRFSPYSKPTAPTQASQDACQLEVVQSGTNTLLYCKTQNAYISNAVFRNSLTGEEVVRAVNTSPAAIHMLSVPHNDIPATGDICVLLELTKESITQKTACLPLVK